jgi:hypothetical protein
MRKTYTKDWKLMTVIATTSRMIQLPVSNTWPTDAKPPIKEPDYTRP